MEIILLSILIIVLIVGVALIYFKINSALSKPTQEKELEALIHKVFGMSSNQIAEQSRHILSGEKDIIKTDLENKQRAMEHLYKQVQSSIDQSQQYLQKTEKERHQMFGEMRQAILEHQRATQALQVSTDSLSKMLQNNQLRGQWGERIIEDLLQSAGLIEGIHYMRQTKLSESMDKPDITLILPNKRVVPIDAKFPFADLQRMATAEHATERKLHLNKFGEEVKKKIRKVATYVKPESDTLDYAIMFVPNEMVFSLINQKFGDLVEEAMQLRVMMVSPFSFLIVVRTILESYRNFMMESNLRDIVKYINEFAKEWSMFSEEFDKFGTDINKLEAQYRKIRDTRHRQMVRKIEKIEDAKSQVKLLE